MDARPALVASFLIGALIQLLLLARRPFPWSKAAICAVCALLAFLPGKHEVKYDGWYHALFSVVVFGFMFAFTAQRACLPVVREGMVWTTTLVLWFVFLLKWDLRVHWHLWLALILLLPGLWSLYLSWSNRPPSRAGKIADYLWFLAAVVLLGIWGYPFSPLALFGSDNNVPWISPLDGFLGGMTFMMLVIYGTYLYLFIPIPGKHQSLADRMKEWREFIANMTDKFHDARGNRVELAALSVVLIGVFLMHYWVTWMTKGVVVGLAISLISIWSWFGGTPEIEADKKVKS